MESDCYDGIYNVWVLRNVEGLGYEKNFYLLLTLFLCILFDKGLYLIGTGEGG